MKRLSTTVVILLAASIARGARLDLTIVNEAGSQLPARVHISDENGKEYAPRGATPVPIGPDSWFASRGRVVMDVPATALRVHVERGPEYVPLREVLRPEDTGPRKLVLRRWIDMRARGYRSGENHTHVAAADLAPMLAAEDLDFGNSMYWWNDRRLALPPSPLAVMKLNFAGHSAPATIFDAEVENAWGAVYLTGLTGPMPVAWDPKRSNLAFVRVARRQRALISYQGGYSREVLLDALLGLVDVVNVCNNNFHRFKYQPRARYSNLLAVPGFPEYPDSPEGMMRMNMETYYRLLNCGLRLAAGAGSATGPKSTPIGYNRSYVRAGKDPTAAQFLAAWREGRNFVTNGPMVLLSADGGRQPGDTVALPASGGSLRLRAEAISDQPLKSLEIVINGRVAGRAELHGDATRAEVTVPVTLREGSWVAARATSEDSLLSDDEMKRYRQDTRLSQAPCRLRFGHTSPIYVTVDGRGARLAEAVAEGHRILNAFEIWARKNAAPEYLEEILDALRQARKALG